ncbi:hypothetical protein MCO_00094 [Bartonella sp. DB5-6]|nr:hypothetical protein MCO_00094 [Bartonella sp. DB5-6]
MPIQPQLLLQKLLSPLSSSEHSQEALKVIEQARCISKSDFIFSFSSRAPISPMVMAKYMRKIGLEAHPHGFRSSLRNWLAETTDTPYEVAETILSYTGRRTSRACLSSH